MMAQLALEPLAHQEAIDYFRSKGFAPQMQRFSYKDVWREEHARNWVVAKAMRDDVSTAIRAEVDRALAEGRTLAQFQADLAPTLQRLGWWGKGFETDPVTGETQPVQLGSMRRLRTIFDTNMRTAHAAGHWARIQRTKRAFPYLQYIQIERPSKRHDHARFHDKIWRVDDPIWLIIYPPNGYFCGCTVIQRTEGWMKRNGRVVSPPMDLDAEPWVNNRTGEVTDLPRGITPGFDTNPGAAWLDIRDDWDRMTPDLTPERRASEVGIIEGLRLTRLRNPRETLVVLNGDSEPIGLNWASPEMPGRVDLGAIPVEPGASLFHSHMTDSPLSYDDLDALSSVAGTAITAITPAGSIFRAVRAEGVDLVPMMRSFFATTMTEFADELRLIGAPAQSLYNHARMRWLENEGAIAYSWKLSGALDDFMEAHRDLVERLINAARR